MICCNCCKPKVTRAAKNFHCKTKNKSSHCQIGCVWSGQPQSGCIVRHNLDWGDEGDLCTNSMQPELIHLLIHTRDAITARQWCQLGPIQSWWLRIVCGNIINIIWQGQCRYSRTANKLKSVFGQRVYFSTRADCDDGSDEMVCTRTCLVEEFTCKNGLCIQVKRKVSLPENANEISTFSNMQFLTILYFCWC